MKRQSGFDPITLEIYRALYTSVAEEMGIALRRTSFSPNIKERRDYSCAVFDTEGRVIAQGDHMPVHLGSMPMAVRAALQKVTFSPGDTVALNDPFAGGTHLPDVTLVAGVFGEKAESRRQKAEGRRRKADSSEPKAGSTGRKAADEQGSSSAYCPLPSAFSSPRPLFYVANRAHHADIGGGAPGSMGMAADIYGEGVRIPPLRLISKGKLNEEVFDLLLANVRAAEERRADFEAQLGSLKTGEARLREIIERSGAREAAAYAGHLIEYAARIMRRTIAHIPDGVYEAEDWLDDDGVTDEEIRLRVRVTIKGERARVDFSGSHAQVRGPVNAVEAITTAAVTYVFRCLVGADDVPASAGLMQPIEVIAPPGTIVNALHPAPVAGGNVETSQRIVDVLFKALARALPHQIPAASQGTMNNLTIGGVNPHTQQEFAYYETMAGGMGARPSLDGISAVH
nr:hydantoinase B/oxoprolinase family protein [Pyrinomonadaceae bacterium]